MATNKEPMQMDPKDVVVDLTNESRTAVEQQDDASVGTNHHVPTVPATVTCTTFLMTWNVQWYERSIAKTSHPLGSDSQFPRPSHPEATYTVETNDTAHHALHPTIKKRELYAKAARPMLDLTAVVAETRLHAAKGMRPHTT